ncbi:MAG TPA: PaaI family thioesterase [Gemmatimonadales bacterium]|nr:PaaI family thioesterase [Gemmatimonadales bacterium]
MTESSGAMEARVRASFERQGIMRTLGAVLTGVGPGTAEIRLPYRADLTQQHGLLHAGVVATIADSASGYAAFSLMPPEAAVLTIEYKINLMAPATGEALVARGQVLRAGKTVTVCQANVHAMRDGAEHLVATLLATVMTVMDRKGLSG